MKKNNDSVFIKLPKDKKIKFIETYRNVLFIKLKQAKKRKEDNDEKQNGR